MVSRTQIVAAGLLAVAALGVGAGTAQAQVGHRTLAEPAASNASGAASDAFAPAIRIPRPGQDDGQGGDFQAPRHLRSSVPSASGEQAGGSAAGGSVPGGTAAVPRPGPVSGLLAPVVGALHL